MRLKTFSVNRYRSITATKKVSLGRTTVLVGPNNEGKSNILRALVTAMNILIREKSLPETAGPSRAAAHYFGRRLYEWETDFPLGLQEKNPKGQTSMVLEFELEAEELTQFREEIGSKLTGTLPIRITVGRGIPGVAVAKQGPGSKALSQQKSKQIARFVTDRIDFQHIEAVRTAASAQDVVTEMVARELYGLEEHPEYKAALAALDELQRPILETLSSSIQKTLSQFLHEVKDVTIEVPSAERFRSLRRACAITVDDGTPTLLEYKGDGAQSLAAIAIIRHAAERRAGGKNSVIAIEEPESHLHPNAIHELKQVIDELSEKCQVIITTHNPLFVDRRFIHNNVIVRNKTAKPATSIAQVRDILGVRASDNLRHAEMVLIVEGEDDRIALSALLPTMSANLAEALQQTTLAIESMGGGGNLSYKVTETIGAICLFHVLLDDDKAGRDAFEKAKSQGLLGEAEVNFCICDDRKDTELEDLYDEALYRDLLWNKYRVSLDSPKFKGKGKWSERLGGCFRHCGKQWTAEAEAEVKLAIARAVAADPTVALNKHRRASLDALAAVLEFRLTSKEMAGNGPATKRG